MARATKTTTAPKTKRDKTAAPSTSPESAPRKRRFRPGTVAMREIRRFQKSNKLLMRVAPFQRLVRHLAGGCVPEGAEAYRFKEGAIRAMQEATEAQMVRVLRNANMAAVRNGTRVTVQGDDISFVLSVQNPAHRDTSVLSRDDASVFGITDPAIRRMCRRAGIKRMNKQVYEVVRDAVVDFIQTTLNRAVIRTDHARHKTISATDVAFGLQSHGTTLLGYGAF